MRLLPLILPLSSGLPAHKQIASTSKEDLPSVIISRPSTLVLCEDFPTFEETYSILVNELRENMSLSTTFADLKEADVPLLFKRGILQFDNILLFLPSVTDFGSTSPDYPSQQGLVRAFDSGANIVMVTGRVNEKGHVLSSKAIRDLARDFGIGFHPPPYEVFDVNEKPVTFKFRNYLSPNDQSQLFSYPGGIGHTVMTNQEWNRTTTISQSHGHLVSAPKSRSFWDTSESGSDVRLVSVLEGYNEARALFVGSCALFSDENINKGSDMDYLKSTILWTFRRTGVIQWTNLSHSKLGEKNAPSLYTVKDEVKFCIDLWELKLGDLSLPPEWIPYSTNNFQIDFIMLDPYYRLFLKPMGESKHCVTLKLPDVHGVFKFYSDFHPIGYNRVLIESLAPVRNPKHDEYDRFIMKATINYACCFTSLISSVVFIFVLFFYEAEQPKKNQ